MPLTLSHPAVVLPLRRLGLPLAALVIGSMAPDGPLFLGWARGYDLSHSGLGVVTIDLLATVSLLAAWSLVLRDALVDLAPSAIRSRFAPRHRLTAREWVLAPLAAMIGSTTHVVWDAFTHVDRWGPDHFAWLRDDYGGLAGFQWAQYTSSVAGIAIVVVAAIAHLRTLAPNRPRPPAALNPTWLAAAVSAALVAGLVAAVARVPSGLHAMVFHGTIACLLVGGLALAGVCLAWQVARRHNL